MPDTNITPQKSKLCRIIEENLPGASTVSVARKYFRDEVGMEYINQVPAFISFLLTVAYFGRGSWECQGRRLCQAYTIRTRKLNIATMRFLPWLQSSSKSSWFRKSDSRHAENSRNVMFTPHSLRVKYQGSEGNTHWWNLMTSGSMLIDYLSVRNLELVQNIQNPKSPQSLFGVLDNCHSPMGKRLLRVNILQPSSGLQLSIPFWCKIWIRLKAVWMLSRRLVRRKRCFTLFKMVSRLSRTASYLSFERLSGFRPTFDFGISILPNPLISASFCIGYEYSVRRKDQFHYLAQAYPRKNRTHPWISSRMSFAIVEIHSKCVIQRLASSGNSSCVQIKEYLPR